MADQQLENYMNKNYYIVTNFSGIKVGDYLYILENGKPQKIKCFNVAEYSVAKQGYGAGADKYKKLSFVRVSNDNTTIINDKGEKLAEFNDKNEIITNEKDTCVYKYKKYAFEPPELINVSGKNLFLMLCNNNNNNNEKFYSQKISINITSGFLQGKKTGSEPENIVFWKKKLLSTITGATSASTYYPNNGFGGKRKKTKRRSQIRRKTKKQRKHK
jgi:hypothetical protein